MTVRDSGYYRERLRRALRDHDEAMFDYKLAQEDLDEAGNRIDLATRQVSALRQKLRKAKRSEARKDKP